VRRSVWIAIALGLVVVVAVALAILWRELSGGGHAGPVGPGSLRFQRFDTDPGWQAENNRRPGRCTTTRQAFGGRADGAIGGLITRATRPAWYGRRVSAGLERPLSATGVLEVRRGPDERFPGGSAIIGFFNQANRDWRPPSQLGFQINADPVNGGDYSVVLAYGAGDYQTNHVDYGGRGRPFGFRFGRRYPWRLVYDPRAAGGRGRITLTIPGAGPPARLTLSPGARAAGAALDRVGMTNQVVTRGRALHVSIGELTVDGAAQDASAGRGWKGHGNRVAFRDCLTGQPNLFGWTGPRDRRLGGLVARTDEDHPHLRAFYADRVGRLSLDDRLRVSGTVRLDRANSDSATLLGWFKAGSGSADSGEQAPPDFVGVSITGPSRVGQYFAPLVSDRKGQSATDDTPGIVLNPGPRTYRWIFDYFPDSGRAGVVVLRLGDRRTAWSLPPKVRRAGAVLNRFGMRNLERGGSFQVVYFDDLAYTVNPSGDDRGDGSDGKTKKRHHRGGGHHSEGQGD
jgi:hypothetical protein